jgi:tRNA (guanosine-2'-O-)-methyltransferase
VFSVTLRRRYRIREVLAKRQPDLSVLLERVHKPHNLSAILRSCDAVGVLEAHAVSLEGRVPTFNETSASAEKWVPLITHETTRAAFTHLHARGFQIVATHLSETAVDYREVDYTVPTCILLGAEKWGVSEEAAQNADANIIIPMRGMVQSLNVSVAAAVILFEAARQRAVAGLYDTPRLEAHVIERLEYEWLYPVEAEHYRSRNQPYPHLEPLDELFMTPEDNA